MNLADSVRLCDGMHQLDPLQKLECLTTLCNLLLDGRTILDYKEEVQERLTKTWYDIIYDVIYHEIIISM